MAWMHRLTGLLLVAYVLVHIKTLSLIADAGAYEARMAVFAGPFFLFLEWALAVPVMLHAVNGGRLILFESFTFRDDDVLLKNVFIVSGLYALVLAILMKPGQQTMTPLAFWLPALVIPLAVSWALTCRMIAGGLPATFTLQRVTGAFLLIFFFREAKKLKGNESEWREFLSAVIKKCAALNN
jgi:succinate dehydrogenase hydrophobic anchor subunit